MKLPKYLYKYRCWDDDHPYDKRVLTHNEIYFASSRDFNDPFDCGIPITLHKMFKENIHQCFKEYFKNKKIDIVL